MSALSNKGGFWYHIYQVKFTADKCVECFKNLMKNRKSPVILIVDGHTVHKSKKVMEYIESLNGKLEIVFLPPYSPDLNPDELVWNQMRNIGTSKKPLKKSESLMNRAILDLEKIKRNRKLIKSFFEDATVSFAAAWVVKVIFGSSLSSRTFDRQVTELLMRCSMLNKLTQLGMPDSVMVPI